MIDRRVLSSMCLAAMWVAGPALGQAPPAGATGAAADVAPSASDALLDPAFRSSTEGIKFRPPAGGILNRQLGSGEIVRFAYPDKAWTLTLKSAINSTHMPMVANHAIPNAMGLLDVAERQLTQRGGVPAQVIRKEVVQVGPNAVGLIEVHDKAGIDPLFIQLALVSVAHPPKYFMLQMVAKGKVDEAAARQAFQQSLATVELLNTGAFQKEQRARFENTRWLWLQLDERRLASALQPVHFMRIVRDGHDVGYVQVNEQRAQVHGQDGIYIVSRQHLETQATTVTAGPAQAGPNPAGAAGLDVPQPKATLVTRPTQVDRDARFFVTYDRRHEQWTTTDRLDNRPGNDALELGNSDVELHRRIDPTALRGHPTTRGADDEPPIIDQEIDTVRVDEFRGKTRSAPTVERAVPKWYLPQAMAQILPRLLPVDQPKQYLFAYYVSGQRQVLLRYVDVGVERSAELDGRQVRGIPIADRVGADGLVTTHYVSRDDGQWLGSVSDDGKLQVLPSDDATLKSLWKQFVVLPDPPPPTDDEVTDSHPVARPVHPAERTKPGLLQPDDPSQLLPQRLDSGPFGGR
jgi:hypothetical protein